MQLLMTMAGEAVQVFIEMAPWLLFGFFVAGVLSVILSPKTVERHLGGNGLGPVFKASLLGVPLPLCSCGVIPVGASLRRHGASRGATASFLLSTPQTGVDSVLVTYALLGPVLAVFRPVVALATGIIGGGLVTVLGEDRPGEAPPQACDAPCCTGENQDSRLVAALRYAFITLPRDLVGSLTIGLVLVGIIAALVPDDFFAAYLGSGLLAMVAMMLLGLPLYVCATASVPIAAALIAKGVSPGAALVFLIAGPATNAATLATIWKVLGRRSTLVYLGTVGGSALAAGLLLDWLYTAAGHGPAMAHGHELLPEPVKIAAALFLLAVLIYAYVAPRLARQEPPAEDGAAAAEHVHLAVPTMTCGHCADTVRQALGALPGVARVTVDLPAKSVEVAGTALDEAGLITTLKAAGFDAQPPAS